MSRSRAFCDGFTVTTPKDNGPILIDALRPYLDGLGCTVTTANQFRAPDGALLLTGNRGAVAWVQCKGKFVALLRSRQVLNEFLSVFSLHPHRVSQADLSVDEYVESPAERVQGVYGLAKAGGVAFSQRPLTHRQINQVFAPTLYDDTGRETGTVYLGNRTAEVRGRVYDKTQERAADGECIGLTVRHEMSITGKMGVSLRDLAEPESCFYHFWPSVVLSKPAGVKPWESHADGFVCERRELLPAQRLKLRVSDSTDLAALISLAQECGPEGMRLLHRLIDERAATMTWGAGHG